MPAIANLLLALFLLGGMSTAQAAKFNCSITSVSPADPTEGEAVTFEGTATDGGSPYNFTWDFGDGSSSVDTGVAEGGTSSVTNTYTTADTYTVTMTVNGKLNGRKQSTCKLKGQLPTATVVVGPAGGNNPPVVTNPGTQTNDEGDTVSLSINATDDDPGDILDYSASGLPANLGIDASTGLISGTVAAGAAANSSYSVTVDVNDGTDTTQVSFQWVVNVNVADCNPATTDVSINTTSQSGCPDAVILEQEIVSNDIPAPDGNTYSVLAINDLGMHCGDLDTRISSILPPFQVLLGQVIQKGSSPTLNPAGVSLEYSAASNLNDPASDPVTQSFPGLLSNGSTYKTNFWNTVINTGVYNAFYPFDIDGMMTEDLGLPVPNVKTLYINGAGNVVPGGTGIIEAVQHAMPGIDNPYGGDNFGNAPQAVQEHYDDKPFFIDFPFGYVAENVNWYEGAGIPFAAYDDYGRENAYPLVRVEAKLGTETVSTVDTVLPISGEASCTNCHTTLDDYVSVHGDGTKHRTSEPTLTLSNANLPVAISVDDEEDMPPMVSLEYAADINVLR
ncbi:MAG: putative Ig domain-containing protein, partial [Gammaproteobacteria bacterium]